MYASCMRNLMLGFGTAILLSIAFAAGNSHVRQTSGHFETKMEQWGEFMPDQYVTDGPSYLQLLEDEKKHSASFWAQISALGTQGWEPVSTATTVAQYQ